MPGGRAIRLNLLVDGRALSLALFPPAVPARRSSSRLLQVIYLKDEPAAGPGFEQGRRAAEALVA